MLLRLPAYRHVLWNSTSTATTPDAASKGTPSSPRNSAMNTRQIFQFAAMVCLVQAHLHREGVRTEESFDALLGQALFLKLLIYSTLDLLRKVLSVTLLEYF
jgi:hypothetical protein